MVQSEDGFFCSKANVLLERPAPLEYINDWTELLGREKKSAQEENEYSFIIFRLEKEYLALSTLVFSEVYLVKLIRRIPHCTAKILLGLVNLRGKINLCFDVKRLLEISNLSSEGPSHLQRMIALRQNSSEWVFVADEVVGLFSYRKSMLTNVPVTLSKSTANYLKGIVEINGKQVSVIDEELLFYSLEKRIA